MKKRINSNVAVGFRTYRRPDPDAKRELRKESSTNAYVNASRPRHEHLPTSIKKLRRLQRREDQP